MDSSNNTSNIIENLKNFGAGEDDSFSWDLQNSFEKTDLEKKNAKLDNSSQFYISSYNKVSKEKGSGPEALSRKTTAKRPGALDLEKEVKESSAGFFSSLKQAFKKNFNKKPN
jgi:hypothetical protein